MKIHAIITAISLAISGAAYAGTPDGAKVIGVVNGDTVILLLPSKETVQARLNGIEAPGMRQPFGVESKRALSGLVYKKKVSFTRTGEDSFGRPVTRIETIGGYDVSKMMLAMGYAWSRGTNDAVYKEMETNARKERKGLWLDASPVPPWQWRKAKHLAKFDMEKRYPPMGSRECRLSQIWE